MADTKQRGSRRHALVLLVVLFAFISSFMLMVVLKNAAAARPARQDSEAIARKIKELEKERERLKKEIKVLTLKLNDAEKKAAQNDRKFKELKDELDRLRALSGFTELEGPGLEIVISDASFSSISPFVPDKQKVVHDSDLRLIVNGLNLGGAEGISINNERIVSFSSIRCVGPTILINNRPVSSPFVIKAIGNPDRLIEGLYQEQSLKYYLEEVYPYIGIEVQIRRQDKVRVPAYEGYIKLDLSEIRVVEQ